jgi:hypothetical protein
VGKRLEDAAENVPLGKEDDSFMEEGGLDEDDDIDGFDEESVVSCDSNSSNDNEDIDS